MKTIITIVAIISIGFTVNAQGIFDEYSDIVKYISENMEIGQPYGEDVFEGIVWTEETDSMSAKVRLIGTNHTDYYAYFAYGLKDSSFVYRTVMVYKEQNKNSLDEKIKFMDEDYFKIDEKHWYYHRNGVRIKVSWEYDEEYKSNLLISTIDE